MSWKIFFFVLFLSPIGLLVYFATTNSTEGVLRMDSLSMKYETEIISGEVITLQVVSVRHDKFGNQIFKLYRTDESGLEMFDPVEIFSNDLYIGQKIKF